MNAISRRAFLLGTTSLGLAGCVSGGATSGNGLSFAQIQAQAAQLRTAIDASDAIFQASTTVNAQQKADALAAQQLVDTAEAAIATAVSTTSAPTAQQLASTFFTGAQQMLPILAPVFGVNPMTGAAITLGLAVVQAFVTGGALPAGVTLRAAAIPGLVEAPVAVPPPAVPLR